MIPIRSLAAVVGCMLLAACSRPANAPIATPAVAELQKVELVVGTGDAVAAGQTAVVHYTGWVYDPAFEGNKGNQFDSSRTRGVPFRFEVGGGNVIKGWDEGVVGMQVGGQRRLVVPPNLGYGSRRAGPIPRNSTLLFEIELLAIE